MYVTHHNTAGLSNDKRACMRASRIMKLVAQVSSSSMSALAPSSSASWMPAAWLVLPLASSVRKAAVSRPATGQHCDRELGRPVRSLAPCRRCVCPSSSAHAPRLSASDMLAAWRALQLLSERVAVTSCSSVRYSGKRVCQASTRSSGAFWMLTA